MAAAAVRYNYFYRWFIGTWVVYGFFARVSYFLAFPLLPTVTA
jgi:hypothetical protein